MWGFLTWVWCIGFGLIPSAWLASQLATGTEGMVLSVVVWVLVGYALVKTWLERSRDPYDGRP